MVWVTVDIHFIHLPNDLQFGTRQKQLGYLHRIRHEVASRSIIRRAVRGIDPADERSDDSSTGRNCRGIRDLRKSIRILRTITVLIRIRQEAGCPSSVSSISLGPRYPRR